MVRNLKRLKQQKLQVIMQA